MNLTERAEIRKETFYKLTNSRDVPEAPSESGRNLMQRAGEPFIMGYGITNTTWDDDKKWAYLALPDSKDSISSEILPQGQFYNFVPIKGTTYTQSILIDTDASFDPNGNPLISWFTLQGHNHIKAHVEKLSDTTYRFWSTYTWHLEDITLRAFDTYNLYTVLKYRNSGTYLAFYKPKLETSEQPSEWSLAPEDLGWSMDTLVPTQQQRYLWKFEYVYYSDGSVEVTQPTNISIAGADGTNGQTSHVHFAFADNATGGGFSLTTPKAYMGWYADFNETASTDPTKYRWGKWKGDQGLPGKPGADGRTPYLHTAYANSADGRTDFSTSNSGNKRYLGTYTDYTQADSTDPSKYKWVDMVGTVKVGGRNLAQKTSKDWSKPFTGFSGIQNTCPNLYKVITDGLVVGDTLKTRIVLKYTDIKPVSGKTAEIWIQGAGNVTAWNSGAYPSGGGGRRSLSGSGEAVFELTDKINADHLKNDYWSWAFRTDWIASGSLEWKEAKVEAGTVFSKWSPALEDTQEQIDSKADQTLTQEQLNALAEKNNLIKAEMEAKASIDTVDKWITAYENYVKANDADKAKSEQALKEASERILGMRYEVNDLKFAWDAIDRFMSFQNEGLIIGKKDGSAYAKFSDDRISLFSGSSEVMYISQGTLNIANGIFTKTIQIGRFRFETHPADADMLVLRYLGG